MANLTPNRFRAFDANGDPLAGGKLYTYEAGTSTPKDTYTTQDESVANANPVILDADGYADVWLGTGFYKLVLKDSADVTLWTIDDVVGAASNAFSSQVVSVSTNTNVTSVYNNNTIVATASLTLSLLGAATAGDGFYFSVRNQSSGDVTLDPDGSELINGSSTVVLSPNQSCIVVTNGTAWFTIGLGVQADSDNTFSGDNSFTGDNSFAGKVSVPDAGELTISSGAVTVTAANHTIDTESDAATDNLDNISGSVNGSLLFVRAANDERTVVLKNGTGNIATFNGLDIELDNTDKVATLIYDTEKSEWLVVSVYAPVLEHVETRTLSGNATEDFTGYDPELYQYIVELNAVVPSANASIFARFSTDGGSSFVSTGVYNLQYMQMTSAADSDGQAASSTEVALANSITPVSSTSTNGGLNCTLKTFFHDGAMRCAMLTEYRYVNSTPADVMGRNSYMLTGTFESNKWNAFQVSTSSGNLASGSITVWRKRI